MSADNQIANVFGGSVSVINIYSQTLIIALIVAGINRFVLAVYCCKHFGRQDSEIGHAGFVYTNIYCFLALTVKRYKFNAVNILHFTLCEWQIVVEFSFVVTVVGYCVKQSVDITVT